jgi:hypothetical protein
MKSYGLSAGTTNAHLLGLRGARAPLLSKHEPSLPLKNKAKKKINGSRVIVPSSLRQIEVSFALQKRQPNTDGSKVVATQTRDARKV